MAAPAPSPSGFSYAQAAKGRPQPPPQSQTPSSKVTSGAATPATGQFSELAPGSNWADDVETTVAEKASKAAQAKDGAVEPVKDEKKNGASAPATNTDSATPANGVQASKDVDTPSLPNGTSVETPSDTKSQSSEPAWIAERSQRQSSSNDAETSSKNEKKGKKEASVSPSPRLQDAPPPTVNPWMKRMEDNKAKAAAQPAVPKPTPPPAPAQDSSRENQKPKAEPKKKPAPGAGGPRAENSQGPTPDTNKQADTQGKKSSEARVNRRQDSDATTEQSRPSGQARSNPSVAPPPSVQDEISWPTPETVAEKDRKEVSEKDQPTKQTEETPQAAKQRKPEWKAMPVTPNYIYETQNIRGQNPLRGGERGGRGGARGRNGVSRGAANVNGGDRPARNQDDAAVARGRSGATEREVMGPPPKPVRASSASSWNDQNKEPKPVERSARGQSVAEARPSKKGSATPDAARQFDAVAVPLPEAKRNKAAKQAPEPVAKTSDSVPEPTQRRNSIGTQTDEANNVPTESAPARPAPNDARKENRSENNNREANANGPTRGSKRNGRGRGGAREQTNGHHAAEFAPYGVPPSPSVSGRGNHQFSFVQQGRGGWVRGNPRSQSIPYDAYYGRVANPYPGHPQLPPVQTYIPGMYEYPGYPMTAIPYQPYMEQQYLMDMVTTQLEYYFSIDNLLKDIFLRKNMDSQGFVLLDVIANFNRLKSLTQDKDLLRAVCMNSTTIEIRVGDDQKERLRRREDWKSFVLPVDQREVGAQNDGPKQLHRPERPQVSTYGAMPFRGPSSAAPQLQQRGDRRSYDAGLAMMNGYPQQFGFSQMGEGFYGDANMEAARGRAAKSPMNEKFMTMPPTSGLQEDKDGEGDAFPDDQASTLTVVVKVNKPQRVPYHNAASRTFSNGSIDSRSIVSEMGKKPTEGAVAAPNGEAPVNGTDRGVSPAKSATGQDAEISLFWMKDQNLPSEGLPTDVTLEPYEALRLKALDQRGQAATGTCPYDMDVLYQFWCHFLIRNFNSRMYGEFKYFAHEDAKERHNLTGLQNLVKFYAQTLLSTNATRDRLVHDYVDLVKAEPAQLENAAFKQLRSAWRNGALNLKNRKKLNDMIDSSLKERLES